MANRLLEVKNLRTCFHTLEGIVPAVDNISFYIDCGEVLGVVGESGCGKSATALSIMRLIPDPPGKILSGEILLNGDDLLKKTESDMRRIRGKDISMIFQEPMTSLNPVLTIGNQIMEAILLHQKVDAKTARELAIDMLRRVAIPSPERRVDEYPHQLSGGMRQRVMIAMALSCSPRLLICDEPTTALDVTIQAQILELVQRLKQESNMSVMIITHNLGIVAEIANRVLVMYAGKIVEAADTHGLFERPSHPYTQGLLGSVPKVSEVQERLYTIAGNVPNMVSLPGGCRFHPRCEYAMPICEKIEPDLARIGEGRWVSCHLKMSDS